MGRGRGERCSARLRRLRQPRGGRFSPGGRRGHPPALASRSCAAGGGQAGSPYPAAGGVGWGWGGGGGGGGVWEAVSLDLFGGSRPCRNGLGSASCRAARGQERVGAAARGSGAAGGWRGAGVTAAGSDRACLASSALLREGKKIDLWCAGAEHGGTCRQGHKPLEAVPS